jgi:hypothetical protein
MHAQMTRVLCVFQFGNLAAILEGMRRSALQFEQFSKSVRGRRCQAKTLARKCPDYST